MHTFKKSHREKICCRWSFFVVVFRHNHNKIHNKTSGMTSVLSRMTSLATFTHKQCRRAHTHAPSRCLSRSHTQTTGIPESLYLKWALGMFCFFYFILFSAFRHSIKSGQREYSAVEREWETLSDDKHRYDKIQPQQWVNSFLHKDNEGTFSRGAWECDYEMFEPDPNSYKFAKAAKYHLPNLQLFQIQPYYPTSHFQSLSFLPLSSHHKSQNFEHQRERERERAQQRRWGERLNLAFREWSGRCLEIFHILFTAGRFQPGTAESWRVPLPGHSSSLSFLSVPGLLRLKISVSLQTFPHRLPLINTFKPKANTSALPPLPAAAGERQRGNQTPDKKNPFHAAGAQQPPFHFNIKVRV